MKEKYEDLILRIVSKRYPYIKKIVFTTMVDDPDLTVTIHVDTDMISELWKKDVDEPQDYVHHLFQYDGVGEETRKEGFKLDELLCDLTSPLSKLLVTENTTTFTTGSYIQYVKYDIMS